MSEKPTIRDVAEMLADAHRKEDPATTEIYLAPSEVEVRLVEISTAVGDVGTSDEWPILPICFAKQRDIPFPSAVVLLGVAEWDAVKAKEKSLPEGWELEKLVSLPVKKGAA